MSESKDETKTAPEASDTTTAPAAKSSKPKAAAKTKSPNPATTNDKRDAVPPTVKKARKSGQKAAKAKGAPVDDSADADGDTKADGPSDTTVEHVKVFTLGGKNITGQKERHGTFNLEGFNHDANKIATRQYMIAQGLRPVGEVEFVGASTNPDGMSLDLTYKVNAVPAELATTVETEHATAVEPGTDAGANLEATVTE